MDKTTENGEDYIVYHFQMGAVDGIYSNIAFPNEAARATTKLDTIQPALEDEKGHVQGREPAILPEYAITANDKSGQSRWHNLQHNNDSQGTVLTNNAVEWEDVHENSEIKLGGTYVSLDQGKDVVSGQNAQQLGSSKVLAQRNTPSVKPHQGFPSRSMICILVLMFVIVFLVSSSALTLGILFKTGRLRGLHLCDCGKGDPSAAQYPELPMDIQDMKVQILELKKELNLTRQELQEIKKVQYPTATTALWTSLNSTKQVLMDLQQLHNSSSKETLQEFQKIWTKVQNTGDKVVLWSSLNSTRQMVTNLQQTFDSMRNQSSQELQKIWTKVQSSNETQALVAVLNSTLQNIRASTDAELSTILAAGNYTQQELTRMWNVVNASLAEILNTTKMLGSGGNHGNNGSQGLIGSQGPPGPMGIANFSQCKYKFEDSGGITPGSGINLEVYAVELQGVRIVGATCSTNYAAEYIFTCDVYGNVPHYKCHCKGQSSLFIPFQGDSTHCFIHYWECPITT